MGLSVCTAAWWCPVILVPAGTRCGRQSPTVSIISKGHKLLLWLGQDKEEELHHLQEDPRERNNRISQKPELAAGMKEELQGWLKSARHSYEKGDYPGYIKQGRFIKEAQ